MCISMFRAEFVLLLVSCSLNLSRNFLAILFCGSEGSLGPRLCLVPISLFAEGKKKKVTSWHFCA